MLKICQHFLPIKCRLSIYFAFVYTYLVNPIQFWGDACKKYMQSSLIFQKACIRFKGGAKDSAHCKPIVKRLNL